MNMSGPGRFHAVMNQPQLSRFVGYPGNLGKNVKIREMKKNAMSTIDVTCAAPVYSLNFWTEFNNTPRCLSLRAYAGKNNCPR